MDRPHANNKTGTLLPLHGLAQQRDGKRYLHISPGCRRQATGRRAVESEEERLMKILPDDPLVRWLIYLCLFVSIGAPILVALVITIL